MTNLLFNQYLRALFLMLTCLQGAIAKDLGTHGKLYPIIEKDFLEFIYARLYDLQKTNQIELLQSELSNQARKHAARPSPVRGLNQTQVAREWLYDPSITLTSDLTDHQGNVIIPAGKQFNPLDHVSLSKTLIFLDNDDPRQRAWVEQKLKASEEVFKLILVQGNIPEAAQSYEQAVYFDQGGRLVAHFAITQVPAIIKQHGDKLLISEVIP